MKKLILFLLALVAIPSLNAGSSGAAWGAFGGLAAVSLIASANRRDRNVVVVNNDNNCATKTVYKDRYGNTKVVYSDCDDNY